MFFHFHSFSFIFVHFRSFSFIFFHYSFIFLGAQNLIFLGLNFVTISLDSSSVNPLWALFSFFSYFFCLAFYFSFFLIFCSFLHF